MFREMRRFKQQLAYEECEQILREGRRGVLAVLGDEGYPYAVPLNFVYSHGALFFHVAREGHKLDALAACDKASFCVMDGGTREPDDWWYTVRSVIAFGHVTRVHDPEVILAALRALGGKYFPPEVDLQAEIDDGIARVVILRLEIEHLSGKRVREK